MDVLANPVAAQKMIAARRLFYEMLGMGIIVLVGRTHKEEVGIKPVKRDVVEMFAQAVVQH